MANNRSELITFKWYVDSIQLKRLTRFRRILRCLICFHERLSRIAGCFNTAASHFHYGLVIWKRLHWQICSRSTVFQINRPFVSEIPVLSRLSRDGTSISSASKKPWTRASDTDDSDRLLMVYEWEERKRATSGNILSGNRRMLNLTITQRANEYSEMEVNAISVVSVCPVRT